MKREGKTDAALAWAKKWDHLDDFLKLNAILTDDDEASFQTVYSDSEGEKFIDGSARHVYTFMLKLMLPWSDGYDRTNQEAERLLENWADWVDRQFPDNTPDFGGARIEGIRALYDVPSVTVYQEDSLAEYNFQASITYVE